MTALKSNNSPTVLTIFGASGDLTKLKLFPAIYYLKTTNKLPKEFKLIGYGRTMMERSNFQNSFRESLTESVKEINEKIVKELLEDTYYYSGQYDSQEDFQNLRQFTSDLMGKNPNEYCSINYFSIPPNVFENVIKNLGETRGENEDIRLVIEKPFGFDQKSAKHLFHLVGQYFKEREIFLLDHYLGKNVIENILNLRYSNRIINQMLQGSEIANIQIIVTENFGVENRLGYFDQVGIIKDFVQSHILQILALFTMAIPISTGAKSVRREKYSILSALKFVPDPNNLAIGQYESYKSQDPKVSGSNTITAATIKLNIDRQDWFEIPVYIKTGKSLDKTKTYIVVELKKYDFQHDIYQPNRLIFSLKPEEKISIKLADVFQNKDHEVSLDSVFPCFDDLCVSEHAQLIYEVMKNKKVNFLSFPEVLASWKLVDNITDFIDSQKIPLEIYKDNSNGTQSMKNLPQKDGFKWYEV